jgi:hypothetical protein
VPRHPIGETEHIEPSKPNVGVSSLIVARRSLSWSNVAAVHLRFARPHLAAFQLSRRADSPAEQRGLEPLIPLARLSLDFSGRRKAESIRMRCYATGRDASVASAMFASCDRSIALRSACRLLSRTRGSNSRNFAYDPAPLTEIQEGDPLTQIADDHGFLVEGAQLRGGQLAERSEVAR